MNRLENKILPFLLGAVATYIIIKLFFLGSILGYADLRKIINDKRSYPLKPNYTLDLIANCRVKYLVDNNLWTHDGHPICFNKYGVYSYGEILGQGYTSDYVLVDAWLNSPTHKNVILMKWKYIGIAKLKDITVVTFK